MNEEETMRNIFAAMLLAGAAMPALGQETTRPR